jgi:hypothetical protein
MALPDYFPADYDRVQIARRPREFFGAKFGHQNIILMPGGLTRDFNPLAEDLKGRFNGQSESMNLRQVMELKDKLPEDLQPLAKSIAEDMQFLHGGFGRVSLHVIFNKSYTPDFYVFHGDHGFAPSGRALSCYTAPVTEILRNDQAKFIGGDAFEMLPGAKPFSFNVGDIWRQATMDTPGVLPAIHRAVEIAPGAPPRLVLTADP